MCIERYIKEPSKRTPRVILEPGRIFIMGRSIPDNAGDFYGPILNWVSGYVNNYNGSTMIEFGFEYLNTTSTKWIFIILKELSSLKDIAINAKVTWYYEEGDDDMSELGFILRSLVDCPFIVVEHREMNQSMYDVFSSRLPEPIDP